MADRLQRERDAFEAFARREGWTDAQLMRDELGHYFDPNVRAMWLGWAGRAADDSGVAPCAICESPDLCKQQGCGDAEWKRTHGVPASHPLSVMCGCAKCQAAFKAEADARGVMEVDRG